MNCAALPENLIEAELFGHEAGSFTGAAKTRHGRFEEADGGTLFLDELGDLVDRRRRTGCCARSNMARSPASARPSRSRSTSASSPRPTRICPRQVDKGRFRADLLDRLSFEVITLPPLRARQGDIPLLAEHFGRRMAVELEWPNWPGFAPRAGRRARGLSAGPAMSANCATSSSARSIATRTPSGRSTRSQFDPFHSPWAPRGRRRPRAAAARRSTTAAEAPRPPRRRRAADRGRATSARAVAAYERALLEDALRRNRFNQRATAAALGLSYDQLRHALKRHKLTELDSRS